MAYRNNRKRYSNKSSKVRMGKTFRTRKGRIGCYKYIGNRRVAFVSKRRY